MKPLRVVLLVLGALFAVCAQAWACPSCAVASEKARFAYYATTGFLSLLPLAMVGSVVYYVARKGK